MSINNIGIILDELSPNFQRALSMVKKVGIEWVELRVLNGKNVAQLEIKEAREFGRILKENGLKVCAISSPLLKCFLPGEENLGLVGDQFGFHADEYTSHLDIVDHLMDLAEIFGTPLLRVFTFWKGIETTPLKIGKIAELMTPLATKAGNRGFILAVENEPSCYVQTASQLHLLLEKLDSPNVRALWDPGNAKLAGEDERKGYEEIKDSIVHVHLKDFKSVNGMIEFTLPGEGEVDIAFVMTQLVRSNYKGVISLEPCRGGLTLEELKNSVEALLNYWR